MTQVCTLTTFTEFLKKNATANFVQYLSWIFVQYYAAIKWEKLATLDLKDEKISLRFFVFQIENEYGAFGYEDYPRDTQYLHTMKLALEQFGIESLLFTSDSPYSTKDYGTTDGGK